jgi:folylpolyglutamate synthase
VNSKLRKVASKVTWVLGASKGKELEGILKPLLHPGDYVAAVKFVPVDRMPWVEAMAPQDILAAASASGIATTQLYNADSDLSEALRWAATVADKGPMVIAGSLYLVSDVLRLLREAEQLKNQLLG